jgi:hypothetical protein
MFFCSVVVLFLLIVVICFLVYVIVVLSRLSSLRVSGGKSFDGPTSLSGEGVSVTDDTMSAANYRPFLFVLCWTMDSGRGWTCLCPFVLSSFSMFSLSWFSLSSWFSLIVSVTDSFLVI